jgi:hypothetical protein
MIIKPLTRKFYRAGEPGTLGAVCKHYFGIPKHVGCPFQKVCPITNGPPERSTTLEILNGVDAETLEAMAKAIRATEKEACCEAAV